MNLPNYITLFRILIVPFFFTQLVSYHPGEEHGRVLALSILLAACLSDAIDGFLARALNQQTALGRFLDPLADKLLILSGFLGLLFVTHLPYRPPLWITVTIVFRELIIILGLLVLFLIKEKIEIRPNLLGKFCTAFQMATLCSILLLWKVTVPLAYITALLTIASCLVYVTRELKGIQSFS
ncbi:MAG: CDP-diacylglycerol--glycerol-3-phosphate 3-phosphatidyltransferase [Candidatus Omnitrophica bacterium]|nr:CDP-diacylglycerol--glycerol-3-phosphate 3-phosphatidyltransferase [Candidatus Omnitrophota bacterium]